MLSRSLLGKSAKVMPSNSKCSQGCLSKKRCTSSYYQRGVEFGGLRDLQIMEHPREKLMVKPESEAVIPGAVHSMSAQPTAGFDSQRHALDRGEKHIICLPSATTTPFYITYPHICRHSNQAAPSSKTCWRSTVILTSCSGLLEAFLLLQKKVHST